MTQRQRVIPEFPGAGRTGRHVNHDERSKGFPAPRGTVQSVLHKRHTHALDQGDLGACTGFATAGAVDTEPLFKPGRYLYNPAGRRLYSVATHVDPFAGAWKPDDTGSDGLSAAKAAVQLGFITSYSHAFGIQHALEALALNPVITGVNWYDSFDNPDSNGRVTISPDAQVRGGHEFEVVGYDPVAQEVLCFNSWTVQWGLQGKFIVPVPVWDRLLTEQGDVTVLAA